MNSKIVLAPVLAVILALLLAGAVSTSLLPDSQPHPTPTPKPATSPYGTQPPVPQASSIASPLQLPLLFIGAAVVVCIVAALLFFREKNLD